MTCLLVLTSWLQCIVAVHGASFCSAVGPQVTVDVPDQKGRLDILKVHAKNKKLSPEVELAQVAMRTPGFSGADLANLLNEARPFSLT